MSRAKRAFDLFWAVFGLALLWPLFAAVALLIKLDDGGSVFFRHERAGFRGRPFMLLKFRTMREQPAGAVPGPQLTVGADPRVTRAGRFLRRNKLDELPQLLNVLRGEMSLVGPRPEAPRYVALYTPEQRRVLELLPGITDPASIKYRHESELLACSPDPEAAYIAEIMPEKIRLNLRYAAAANLLRDTGIILRTLLLVFS